MVAEDDERIIIGLVISRIKFHDYRFENKQKKVRKIIETDRNNLFSPSTPSVCTRYCVHTTYIV